MSKLTKEPKQKKCKVCKNYFAQYNTLAQVCSIKCAIEYSKNEKVQSKINKFLIKEKKEKLVTRAQLLKRAQTAFNAFIRERDKEQPCISCGKFHQGQNHAGHYRTVGANPALRFNELNCHLQCSVCNNHKSGNIVEYRINLLKKIGAEKLDWLEGYHEPKKYSVDEIKQIEKLYKNKLKKLKGDQ